MSHHLARQPSPCPLLYATCKHVDAESIKVCLSLELLSLCGNEHSMMCQGCSVASCGKVVFTCVHCLLEPIHALQSDLHLVYEHCCRCQEFNGKFEQSVRLSLTLTQVEMLGFCAGDEAPAVGSQGGRCSLWWSAACRKGNVSAPPTHCGNRSGSLTRKGALHVAQKAHSFKVMNSAMQNACGNTVC